MVSRFPAAGSASQHRRPILFALVARGAGVITATREDSLVLRCHLGLVLPEELFELVQRRIAIAVVGHADHPRLATPVCGGATQTDLKPAPRTVPRQALAELR